LRNYVENLWAGGEDAVYIELQLIEKGVERDLIDQLIKELKKKDKSAKRSSALKFMIGGLSTAIIAVVISFFTFESGSPYGYIMYGLIAAGMMTFAKGAVDFLMP
jgi:hypothetical protein